jgi:hypothetical protein
MSTVYMVFRNVQSLEWTLHPSSRTTKRSYVGKEWQGFVFKELDRKVTLEN